MQKVVNVSIEHLHDEFVALGGIEMFDALVDEAVDNGIVKRADGEDLWFKQNDADGNGDVLRVVIGKLVFIIQDGRIEHEKFCIVFIFVARAFFKVNGIG